MTSGSVKNKMWEIGWVSGKPTEFWVLGVGPKMRWYGIQMLTRGKAG